MKKHKLIGLIAAFYLGYCTGLFTNYSFLDWQWWIIVVPTIILFNFEKFLYKNDK